MESLQELNRSTPESDQMVRDLEIAGHLVSLAKHQKALGLPFESPAAVTDQNGQVLALSVASRILTGDPGNLAVVDAMRRAADLANVHQFDGLNFSLHLLGSPNHFDACGAVYNFGPGRVVLTPLGDPALVPATLATRDDYWTEAKEKRGIERTIVSLSSPQPPVDFGSLQTLGFKGERLAPLPASLERPRPTFLAELDKKWKESRFSFGDSGVISKDDPMMVAIMEDLHRAASESVKSGGGPFASVLIDPNGRPIGFGVNRVVPDRDAIKHGEVSAMRETIAQLADDPEHSGRVDLSGFSLVTNAMTCVSCAEQMGLCGIQKMYFENPKEVVECETRFTEGPIRGDFWTITGIQVTHVKTPGDLHIKPFWEFARAISDNPDMDYLADKSLDERDE